MSVEVANLKLSGTFRVGGRSFCFWANVDGFAMNGRFIPNVILQLNVQADIYELDGHESAIDRLKVEVAKKAKETLSKLCVPDDDVVSCPSSWI